MKNQFKRVLATFLSILMLVSFVPFGALSVSAAEPEYKVQIESFIRGNVTDIRCSELLEARIYKSEDGGNTWVQVTDVDGTPLSKLRYKWTNDSPNTPLAVYLSHDMSNAGLYGDVTTSTGNTLKGGATVSAVGAQWAALKTPGYDVNMGGGGWPGFRPGSGSGSGSSSSDVYAKEFLGSITVEVTLPDGSKISAVGKDYKAPSLAADLNNIALGIFEGDTTTLPDLLGESALVHINCTQCRVSGVTVTGNDNEITYNSRTGRITGNNMGECTIKMDVSKEGCTVHNGQEAEVETQIYVFRKPTTSTTTTTLTLAKDSLDDRCKYYINGVEGTLQDGNIVFTGLTPDTKYTVDVVAEYVLTDEDTRITKYAYAYVSDTTKPVYTATVRTFLNGTLTDVSDIHGEDVAIFIKTDDGTGIDLTHNDTGIYTATADNGAYHVYHHEDGGDHQISENYLIISNASATIDVYHYSVSYDTQGGAFKKGEDPGIENFASGKAVVATNSVPQKEGYIFAGWNYNNRTYKGGNTVTNSISQQMVLTAKWVPEVDVFVNVTIDHTYTDGNGNLQTDSNDGTKDDIEVSLVAREGSAAPYLEVENGDLALTEKSHRGHTLYADSAVVDSYAGINGIDVVETKYVDSDEATFTGLSGAMEYSVTVAKKGYDSYVTATQNNDGDWVIDVLLKFAPESHDLDFEIKMDPDLPEDLYPEAAIVKILYFDTYDNTWKIITQHDGGNPGVRVNITGETGNKGSYPVWAAESGTGNAYGYRIKVSAFVYEDGTIVLTDETEMNRAYSDGEYTATAGNVSDGKYYGVLKGAYFNNSGDQVGTLDATVSREAYDVTFDAQGGFVNGDKSQTVTDQYYIPDFDGYQPTMTDASREEYNFLGWWYKDQNGNYTEQATEGTVLTEDVTLYAMWERKLVGEIQIAGTYTLNGEEVDIWESDRATEAIVVLQEISADNNVTTVKYETVYVDWYGDEGMSQYRFRGLNPLKQYRIDVLLVNYTTQYQNITTEVGEYNDTDYTAVYDNYSKWLTYVNARLDFDPESYYQPVEVDASQIGAGFRPTEVTTEIHYVERNTGNEYKRISQHNATGGITVALDSDGKTDGTYGEYVWNENFNGNIYDYKLIVNDADIITEADDDTDPMPVTIMYGPESHFDTVTGQAKNTLTATLIPKKFEIIYDLNTDDEDDVYIDFEAHTWSHDTEITAEPTREGYIFRGWEADIANGYDAENKKVLASVREDITLTAIWEKADYKYTVEYYYDNVLGATVESEAEFESVINNSYPVSAEYEEKTYALDSVDGQPLTIGTNESANLIKVYYATDNLSDEEESENTPDQIPDKYQAVVKFNIVNGTWVNSAEAQARVYTLYEKNNDGEWEQIQNVPFGVTPAGTPNEGYDDVCAWSPAIPQYVEGSATYTLSYNKESEYTVTVEVVNGLGNIKGEAETFTTKAITVVHGNDVELEFANNADFALDYVVVDGVTEVANGVDLADFDSFGFENVTENHTIRVIYDTDTVGNGEDFDGIPDKYQKKVTFTVVNGTWEDSSIGDIIEYLTLKTDGKWDVNGSAQMPEVPENMKASAGFKKGSWNVESFPATLRGTDAVTYTHTFKAIAYVDYVYNTQHYKQQADGSYVLAETVTDTIASIELNADENDFENAQPAVTAVAKDYGAHYTENTSHADRVESGTPQFNKTITLKLYYDLDRHTLSYDLNGGNAVSGTDYSDVTVLCGNEVRAAAAPQKKGYTFEGWQDESGNNYAVNAAVVLNEDVTLTAQWAKQTGLSYIVRFFDEETNNTIAAEKLVGSKTYEDVVNSADEIIDIEGYLFSYADPESIVIDVDVNSNVIDLYYTKDVVGGENGGDDIPDKYQKKVIFKVVNGTWNGTSVDDVVKYVTLKTNGAWDVNGEAVVEDIVPAGMVANEGFGQGAWDASFPATVTGTADVTYTHTFVRLTTPVSPTENVRYIVEHYKANADGTYPETATETEFIIGVVNTTVTAVAKTYEGYCVNPAAAGTVSSATLKAITSAEDIVTLKLYYDTDVVGGENGGDEIPDKYQKKVIFKVVNGTWDGTYSEDIVKYVALKTNGVWDVNGVAEMPAAPENMKANEGFEKGKWDKAFPETLKGVNDETFTYSFAKTQVKPPLTSDNFHLWLWLALMLVSGIGFMGISISKNRVKF